MLQRSTFFNLSKLFPAVKKWVSATYAPYVENFLTGFQRRFKVFELEKASYDFFTQSFLFGGVVIPYGVVETYRPLPLAGIAGCA